MGRVLLIVSVVAALLATEAAVASPVTSVRVPISVKGPSEEPKTVVVEKGDHLWSISARHLDEVSPGLEVAPYWRTVVRVNQPRLRSGDPDLIYPGEIVELPATSELP